MSTTMTFVQIARNPAHSRNLTRVAGVQVLAHLNGTPLNAAGRDR